MINTVKKWVNYEGRNKYKYAGSNLKYDSVINMQGSTTGGGSSNQPDDKDNVYPWQLYLSKVSNVFDKVELQNGAITDTSYIIGYVSTNKMPVYVGNLSKSETENSALMGYEQDEDGNPIYNENGEPIPIYEQRWGIEGIQNGVTVKVLSNGSTDAYLRITVSADAPTEGTLRIPCNLLRNTQTTNFDYQIFDEWKENKSECASVWLEYHWVIDVSTESKSNWQLDLSNQTAFINWDENTNKPVNGAVEPECTATLYYGGVYATAATKEDIVYSLADFPSSQQVPTNAVTIDPETGVIDFDMPRLSFNGTSLSIKVIVYVGGERLKGVEKIMTIYKNLPIDGKPAVTQWIMTTPNQVLFNPNVLKDDGSGSIDEKNALSHQFIEAQVWKQEGGDEPVQGNATIFYGWNTDNPTGVSSNPGYVKIPVDTTGMIDDDGKPQSKYAVFALKNSQNEIYELEEVIVLAQGKNGNKGEDSTVPGPPGESGHSVYSIYLTNENASINCDIDGNIYSSGKPFMACTASLYYGTQLVKTGITWSLVCSAGITAPHTSESNGAYSLDFTRDFAMDAGIKGGYITITATFTDVDNKSQQLSKVMNISKNYPGENGTEAENRWLVVEPDIITCDKTITKGVATYIPNERYAKAKAMVQIGDGAAVEDTSSYTVINWRARTRTTTPTYSEEYTYDKNEGVSISPDSAETYSKIEFILRHKGEVIDRQSTAILINGADGEKGEGLQGATVRGPVEWEDGQMGNRYFCDGTERPGIDDSARYIDIVARRDDNGDVHYYRCIETFSNFAINTWSDVSSKFVQADAEYKFVAADLLLANNAKIKFLTNNEIQLVSKNSEGDEIVNAGARGGDGVNFWAGHEDPELAPFQVKNDGSLTAKTGSFGPWELSQEDGLVAKIDNGLTGDRRKKVESSFDLQRMYLFQESNQKSSYVDINVATTGAPLKITNDVGYSSIETNKPLLTGRHFAIYDANDPVLEYNEDTDKYDKPNYNIEVGVRRIMTITKAEYQLFANSGSCDKHTLYIIIDDVY